MNGVGGDLLAIYYEAKSRKLYGLNASGWAPKALTIDYLNAHLVDKLDPIGVHTVTVPGCVAGWDALRRRFGTMPFDKLLAPAIFYAGNGFPLVEKNARDWVSKVFLKQPGYQSTYLPGGVRRACKVVPSEPSEKLNARGSETIYLSTIDKDGNIVLLIQSNYGGYGTVMVAPGAGFSFQNRGAGL